MCTMRAEAWGSSAARAACSAAMAVLAMSAPDPWLTVFTAPRASAALCSALAPATRSTLPTTRADLGTIHPALHSLPPAGAHHPTRSRNRSGSRADPLELRCKEPHAPSPQEKCLHRENLTGPVTSSLCRRPQFAIEGEEMDRPAQHTRSRPIARAGEGRMLISRKYTGPRTQRNGHGAKADQYNGRRSAQCVGGLGISTVPIDAGDPTLETAG